MMLSIYHTIYLKVIYQVILDLSIIHEISCFKDKNFLINLLVKQQKNVKNKENQILTNY